MPLGEAAEVIWPRRSEFSGSVLSVLEATPMNRESYKLGTLVLINFIQCSGIPCHSELHWVLDACVYMRNVKLGVFQSSNTSHSRAT